MADLERQGAGVRRPDRDLHEGAGRSGRFASREARRRQLIQATIASIAELGLHDTTLTAVTRRAGLSHGTVNFHFKSKERLLVETLRFLTDEHRDRWRSALECGDRGPAETLAAMIAVDFEPEVCNETRLAVWFAFWGELSFRPLYWDVCGRNDTERLTAIEGLCADIAREGGYRGVDPGRVARSLQSLIDGIWLNMLCQAELHSGEEAMAMCRSFLAGAFPRHFPRDRVSSCSGQRP